MSIHKFIKSIAAIIILLLMVLSTGVFAQAPQREEVTVIAPYEPTLPEVFKISLQPRIEEQKTEIPLQQISITPQKINVTHTIEPVQEAPPPTESQPLLFRNHIRGGFGNYLTPYLELNAGSLRNNDYVFNFRAKHLSSHGEIKEYGHSAFSENYASIGANRFFDKMILGAKAGYDRNVVHHYGFLSEDFPFPDEDAEKEELRQRFNNANLQLGLKSKSSAREGFHYDAGLNYGFINDLFETNEHRFGLTAEARNSFELFRNNEKQSLGATLDVGHYRTTDTIQEWSNTLIQLKPFIQFRYQEYEFKVGFGLGFDNDTSMHFKAFPMVEGKIHLVKNRLLLFAGVDGGIKKNSFYGLASENPFIQSGLTYRNTVEKFRFYGGLKGSIANRLDLKATISNSVSGDVAMFVNDTLSMAYNRFGVIYDDMNIINGNLSASLTLSDKFRMAAGFDIFHYSPEEEEKAWHMPSFKTFLETRYSYSDALAFRASVHANGTSWAKVWDADAAGFEAFELKPWLDFNLGATYRYTDQLHFFFNASNITSSRHFYWYNYPGQRLRIMAGAGFSF